MLENEEVTRQGRFDVIPYLRLCQNLNKNNFTLGWFWHVSLLDSFEAFSIFWIVIFLNQLKGDFVGKNITSVFFFTFTFTFHNNPGYLRWFFLAEQHPTQRQSKSLRLIIWNFFASPLATFES